MDSRPTYDALKQLLAKQTAELAKTAEALVYNPKIDDYVWVHAISIGARDKTGEISHADGIFIDVTEKHRAFQELQNSEKELENRADHLFEMNSALPMS